MGICLRQSQAFGLRGSAFSALTGSGADKGLSQPYLQMLPGMELESFRKPGRCSTRERQSCPKSVQQMNRTLDSALTLWLANTRRVDLGGGDTHTRDKPLNWLSQAILTGGGGCSKGPFHLAVISPWFHPSHLRGVQLSIFLLIQAANNKCFRNVLSPGCRDVAEWPLLGTGQRLPLATKLQAPILEHEGAFFLEESGERGAEICSGSGNRLDNNDGVPSSPAVRIPVALPGGVPGGRQAHGVGAPPLTHLCYCRHLQAHHVVILGPGGDEGFRGCIRGFHRHGQQIAFGELERREQALLHRHGHVNAALRSERRRRTP